jgi:hypothetical protein
MKNFNNLKFYTLDECSKLLSSVLEKDYFNKEGKISNNIEKLIHLINKNKFYRMKEDYYWFTTDYEDFKCYECYLSERLVEKLNTEKPKKEAISIIKNLQEMKKCLDDKKLYNSETIVGFGKYKGYNFIDVPNSYLIWDSEV